MAITTQLLTITLNGNGLSVPMIWQMGKNMINVYYRILLSPKSMWSCHCDNMDGLSAYIAKRNKSEGEQNSYNYGNVWNLINKNMNKENRNRLIDTGNKWMVARCKMSWGDEWKRWRD